MRSDVLVLAVKSLQKVLQPETSSFQPDWE